MHDEEPSEEYDPIGHLVHDALPSEEVYKYTVDKLNAYNKKIENRVTDPFTGKNTSVLALCKEYGVSRNHYEEMLASGKTKQQALIIPAKDLKIIAASYQAQGIRYDKNGKYIVYRSNFAVTVSYKDLVKVKQKLNL